MKAKHLLESGLWPENKGVSEKRGIPELEEIGYNLFYEGKNADLYVKGESISVLMVRTDRTSVFDVPLSDMIEGKGVLQNAISNFGYDFAEKQGMKTHRLPMPEDIPEWVAERSQYIQLAKPNTIVLEDEGEVGLELIFRKYLTGSLYKLYKKGEDPYELNLPKGLEEWHKFDEPIFTPTTKGKVDMPLKASLVQAKYSELVKALQCLFLAYSDYAEHKGIVLVDTKFELFEDKLGDEILTPESSRFILKSDFDQRKYISMDKQILRDWFKSEGYLESATKGEVLNVEIPQDIKKKVLAGYQKIYDMLAS